MSFLRQSGVASLIALMAAAPAQAAISAEEVWSLWQKLSQDAGYSLTSEGQARTGAGLVLKGVGATNEVEGMRAHVALGDVTLREMGDGRVEILLPAHMPLHLTSRIEGEPAVDMTLDVRQKGYQAIVSGDKTAPIVSVRADEVVVERPSAPIGSGSDQLGMTVTVNALSGEAKLSMAEATEVSYAMASKSVDLALQVVGETSLTAKGQLQDVRSTFDGTLPKGLTESTDMAAALRAGLRGLGGYITGAGTLDVELLENGQSSKMALQVASAGVNVGIDAAGVDYNLGSSDITATFTGAMVPLPEFTVKAADYRLGLKMPMIRTEAPVDFSALVRLSNLELPEFAWMMMDPTGTLPREPMSVILDLAGKLRLTQDVTDGEALETMDAVPGELHALTLNELLIKGVGAELTGAGAFTFDNSDLESFGGFPRPMGAVDFRLLGGNKLIDQGVALGLISAEDAMGYRMMLAMFTKAEGEGDVLTSRIEVTPEGQVVANGQRLQ